MASFNDLTALFSLGTKVGVNMSSCTAQTTAEAIKYITTNYTVPAQKDTNKAALKDLGTALGVTMTSCTATTDAGVIDYIADHYTAPAQVNSNVTALTDLGTALGVTMTSCTATTDAGVIDFIADNYVAPSGGTDVLVYTLAISGQGDPTFSKTYAEISAALTAGTPVVGYYLTNNVPAGILNTGVSGEYVIATLDTITEGEEEGSGVLVHINATLTSNGTATATMGMYTLTAAG